MKSDKPNRSSQYNAYAKYASLAIQIVLTLGIAIYVGWLLDNYLESTFPLFIILFLLIATAAVFYMLYREIQKDNPDE